MIISTNQRVLRLWFKDIGNEKSISNFSEQFDRGVMDIELFLIKLEQQEILRFFLYIQVEFNK